MRATDYLLLNLAIFIKKLNSVNSLTQSFTLSRCLRMKRCNIKSFFKEGGKRTDEMKSGVLLERDLNRCASAKAVTAAEII